MKNRMNKQSSDIPPQDVQTARFTDQQSIDEVTRLLHTPARALLIRLSGDEHPSPYQYNTVV